jgi:hypothetical protein
MTENDEIVELLEDIRLWVKIIGVQEAKVILKDILSDPDDEDREKALRISNHLTDGSNSNADIAKHIDYSSEFVRNRQNEWADLGLLERSASNQPYRKIISMSEVGIEIPDIPDPKEDQEKEDASTPSQTD